MNSKVIYFYIIAAVSLCFSCGGRSTSVGEQGDTLFLQHAELLRMVRCDDYVKVEVDNPWHPGKKLHTYYLVPASIADDIRQQLATQGTVITADCGLQHRTWQSCGRHARMRVAVSGYG